MIRRADRLSLFAAQPLEQPLFFGGSCLWPADELDDADIGAAPTDDEAAGDEAAAPAVTEAAVAAEPAADVQ